MITKWCIVVSDVDDQYFFLVGPFDSKLEADEFDDEIGTCLITTSIHPYIESMNWVGNARKNHRLVPQEVNVV